MSKSKHTPGPWVAEGMNGVGGMVSTYATPEGELKVITRDIHGRTDDELRANTLLIAAAPELLAALIECEAMLDEFDANSDRTMRIRQAIRKATGSQS